MPQNEKDGLPSYTEALTHSNLTASPFTPSPTRGPQILDELTLVRAQHIRSVIHNSIVPLVEQQASYGIAQTTIALIPSDVPLPAEEEKSEFSFDNSDTKKIEVIGFSSDEIPQIVRLEGKLNRTEFWRPQAVIGELERLLRECLNKSERPNNPTRERFPELEVVVKQVGTQKRTRRTLFGRVQPESVGMVLVRARLEETCLRTVNDFGLYDAMSKQCIIVRVDVRC
ncbi:hypothetical protein K504DRAFT_428438 [Pleomassaria siparia CBS 279.74]|uniref:Uncharacterized protein n=1 Tax=Pleomassaria siparia CBS 279.74 TaxID=1314801 RepID=A0A6G1KFV8_9PLEO|nr:hypothetical protein K504DRAFT_428438 [Pleomassaria siparia CBS 279.74]